MEAASRPPLELLPDLPVEEPLDSAQRAARPPEPPVLPAAPGAVDSKDPVQTSIQFLDPAALLLATAEVPALSPAATTPASGPAPGEPAAAAAKAVPRSEPAPQAPELELLEDPAVVEELLTAPPPPPPVPKPLPAEPAPTLTPAAPPQASTGASAAPKDSAPRLEARVPIARTASLSSAAHKVAAASKRAGEKSAAPAPLAPAPRPAAPAPVAKARADASPPAGAPGSASENLAGWTSARAAAAPVKGKAPAPPAPAAPAPPRPAPAKPAAAKPVPPPPAAASTGGAPLDRDSIARNQIVERYLSGRLPLKGATEFEQFCTRHPEILDELGLPERVNAALRLLEAAGKPEPWQEAPRPAWQKPQVTLAVGVAAAVLAMSLAIVSGTVASKGHRIAELQKQVNERPLDPATSTREIRLLPGRSGASNSPAITIGGAAGGAQLADFKIDESRSPYHIYRITIDRIDQGRVGVITNLVKDSNGHLRLALNSSALGPGNYQLTIEGMNWRGDPEPDSWITIGIAKAGN